MEDFFDMIITASLAVELHNNSKTGQKIARKIVARFMKNENENIRKHVHGIKASKDIRLHLELVYQEIFLPSHKGNCGRAQQTVVRL